MVGAAVVMFSFQFLFNQQYEKNTGSGKKVIFKFTLFANIAGLIVLTVINGFRFEFAPFSAAISAISALNGMLFTFCSIRSFGKINLSLFSVFSMLGGMALPFAAGILFFDEAMTLGKTVCFIIIAVSLFLTVDKEKRGSGFIYYVGVFVFNGMSGVILKFYHDGNYAKTSDAGYSMLVAVWTILICTVLLLTAGGKKQKTPAKAVGFAAGHGVLSCVGNYLLLLGLAQLPASAQYPFVTGGVMIVSTIISLFSKDKPGKREIAAVALSFIGILALVLIP